VSLLYCPYVAPRGRLAKTFLALPIERIRRALAGTAWHFFVGPIPDAETEADLLALADLVAVTP